MKTIGYYIKEIEDAKQTIYNLKEMMKNYTNTTNSDYVVLQQARHYAEAYIEEIKKKEVKDDD